MAEIDFSSLNNLNKGRQQSPPLEGIFTAAEAPLPLQTGTGEAKLQKEATNTGHDLERARQVYIEYQNNIRAAGTLQSEILKGAAGGADLCTLLLSAAECISRMVGDGGVFSKSLRNRLEERALRTLEPLPLAARARGTAERLERLKAAAERAESPAEASLIHCAIKEHEGELKALQALIECGRG